MRLVAGDEHDARSRRHERQRGIQHAQLRVAVQLQRVVLRHARLHPAGCVQDEDVERAERLPDLVEHRRHRGRIGEIRADDERPDAELRELGRELLSPRGLVPVVDDDIRTGLGEIADGVRADASGGPRDEGGSAGQRAGGKGL